MHYLSLTTFLKGCKGFILLLLAIGLASCGASNTTTSASSSSTASGGSSSTTSAPPASTVTAHLITPFPVLTPSAGALGLTVTMADNGRLVQLKPGQILFVALDDVQYDRWTITSSNTAVLGGVSTLLPPHTQISFKAKTPGEVFITAKGDLVCAKGNPPCLVQPQDIQIWVQVK
jgi:hypothetical protein